MRIARSLSPEPDLLVVELAALFHDMAGARTFAS
jgi:HD superfamily phosphodiesterase